MPPSPTQRPWWKRREKPCRDVQSRRPARPLVQERRATAPRLVRQCATTELQVVVLAAPAQTQRQIPSLEQAAQNPLPSWLHLIMKGWKSSAGAECMPQYQDNDVVIIAGVRTAVGKFKGSLSDRSAPQLGSIVVREAVKRAKVDPATVDECIMGNVVSAGLGPNSERPAAVFR